MDAFYSRFEEIHEGFADSIPNGSDRVRGGSSVYSNIKVAWITISTSRCVIVIDDIPNGFFSAPINVPVMSIEKFLPTKQS